MNLKKIDYKRYLIIFIIILFIIIIFTLGDYFIHTLKDEYGVPSYYYRNKIIYGTLIGFIAYILVQNQPVFKRALIFSGVIVILLQIRYAIEGYSTYFVLLFLVVHFFILLLVSYLVFRFVKLDDKV
jgi:hypothetical protein